jgi:hypothetical protein
MLEMGGINGNFVKDTIGAITGSTARDAASAGASQQRAATGEAIEAREAAAERAQGFLAPFGSTSGQISSIDAQIAELQRQIDASGDVSSGGAFVTRAARANPELFRAKSEEKREQLLQQIEDLQGQRQAIEQRGPSPGELGLDRASFLVDPQQQFEFLQSNPLFNLALENADRQTKQIAAARNRLSAGDTLADLSKNVLLASSPLIGEQKRSIAGLLDFGRGVATAQGNIEIGTGSQIAPLLQDIGNIGAAEQIGRANAKAQGLENLIDIGAMAAGAPPPSSFGGSTTGLTMPTRFVSPGAPGSVGFGGGVGL